MEKRILSVEQLNKMIQLLKKVNTMVEIFLCKSDLTIEEAAIAEEVKQATESYIRILDNLPESDAEFWAPVLRAVVPEIIRKVFGKIPDSLMNWIMDNIDQFGNLEFWTKIFGLP